VRVHHQREHEGGWDIDRASFSTSILRNSLKLNKEFSHKKYKNKLTFLPGESSHLIIIIILCDILFFWPRVDRITQQASQAVCESLKLLNNGRSLSHRSGA